MELGARGAYSLAVKSGTMAAGLAANAEIFQMRWIHASFKMLLRSVRLSAFRNTTAFTAGIATFDMFIRRSYSSDGSSGTAIVLSTNNTNKKRTDFALSAFSDTGCRVSSTGALTAGGGTLDTNAAASMGTFVSSAATSVPDPYIIPPGSLLWQRDTAEEYPFLFEQNEGFVVRATVPATGTWGFAVQVEWAELDPAAINGWT